MVSPASHGHSPGHGHPHGHSHGDDHGHVHHHAHGLALPHPAQAAPWSILRLAVISRLAAASIIIAALWGVVWLAMR
jgi:hypothetical protein